MHTRQEAHQHRGPNPSPNPSGQEAHQHRGVQSGYGPGGCRGGGGRVRLRVRPGGRRLAGCVRMLSGMHGCVLACVAVDGCTWHRAGCELTARAALRLSLPLPLSLHLSLPLTHPEPEPDPAEWAWRGGEQGILLVARGGTHAVQTVPSVTYIPHHTCHTYHTAPLYTTPYVRRSARGGEACAACMRVCICVYVQEIPSRTLTHPLTPSHIHGRRWARRGWRLSSPPRGMHMPTRTHSHLAVCLHTRVIVVARPLCTVYVCIYTRVHMCARVRV